MSVSANVIMPEIILSDDNEHYFVTDPSYKFVYEPSKHTPFKPRMIVESLFNKTTLIAFIGFICFYYILYYGLGKLFGTDISVNLLKTRAINLTALSLGIISVLYFYYTLPAINQEHFFTYLLVLFKEEMNEPNMAGVMVLALVIFYIFVWIFEFPMRDEEKPISLHIFEFKSWVYLIMLLIIIFFIYVLHFEIVDYVYQEVYIWWFWLKSKIDKDDIKEPPAQAPAPAPAPRPVTAPSKNVIAASPSPAAVPDKNEVFNIGNNLYTYDDAQAICKAYDARLASYDEVEEAYDDGGEWCNYGWSKDQMILFPTQKSTWKELQNDPSKKHSCGRPGINGGHMPNPYVKFGVNCYGKKPDPNNLSKSLFDEAQKTKPFTPAAIPGDPAVEYWKNQKDNMRMNSHNKKEWSEFSNVR